jgi:hypothetical protein
MAETQVSIRRPRSLPPASAKSLFASLSASTSSTIDLETVGRIGPGKIALLEAIRETGSITAAAMRDENVLSPSVATRGRAK